MTIRIRHGIGQTTVLLLLCCVVSACGIRTATFELAPRTIANRSVYPLRVDVVVDKEFVPYKVTFRYWSSPPLTWSLEGLPDAFVKTLSPHFGSVETLHVGRSTSTGRHDLIAKMSVDRLHFDGANTTVDADKVDLTMTFTLGQPNGTEVFRITLSASASSDYSQPCAFCAADPSEAFTKAFSAVFEQLSESLAVSGIRVGQENGRSLAFEGAAAKARARSPNFAATIPSP